MRIALITALVVALPRIALACPVCFGENDSPIAQAMNSGILLMLGVVAGMLTAFASFFIYLIRRAKRVAAENQATVVRVIAEQFAWNMQYPGPDGKFGRTKPELVSAENPIGLDRSDPDAKDDVTEINQLHLPVDRPALVHLSSKDVIHSFGLYEMRVKQDAIPGMSIPVWFVPTRIGEYDIACSQLCGLGHFRMRGFLTIQSDADFRKWLDDQEKDLNTGK